MYPTRYLYDLSNIDHCVKACQFLPVMAVPPELKSTNPAEIFSQETLTKTINNKLIILSQIFFSPALPPPFGIAK